MDAVELGQRRLRLLADRSLLLSLARLLRQYQMSGAQCRDYPDPDHRCADPLLHDMPPFNR